MQISSRTQWESDHFPAKTPQQIEEAKATLELDRKVKFEHMAEMLILKLFLVDLANREGYSAMTRTEFPRGIIALFFQAKLLWNF